MPEVPRTVPTSERNPAGKSDDLTGRALFLGNRAAVGAGTQKATDSCVLRGYGPKFVMHRSGNTFQIRASRYNQLANKVGLSGPCGFPSPHLPFFAFIAFNAFAQPMLTSSLCCLRHAIILPSPGVTPGHIFSASALQRARGVAALAA